MSIELYMDGTDYNHELGHTAVKLYSSIEEIKSDRVCLGECGIVAVRVEFVRWVEPGVPYEERGR